MFPLKMNNPLMKIINNSIINLPAPMNISYYWNFGSLLGLCLMIQIITGLFITAYYIPNKNYAFYSVINMSIDNKFLWPIQMFHINGASMFFFCLYLHIGRGIYNQSFKLKETWNIGVLLLFLTMAAAFMGYVLPWGQMSFWGATVITNLLNTIPYIGNDLVIWLWGGFSPDNPTLNRFFMIHFIIPFIILAMTIIHLLFLHQTGSNNPLGLNSNSLKMSFYPYLIFKDIKGFIIIIFILINIINLNPYMLGDSDNFIPANPLNTPIHIQPEWYFLFAYAILRSIPNKLGGVIALVLSIAILFILPMFKSKFQNLQFYFLNKIIFWTMTFTVILLTWIGMSPMEIPFINIGQFLSIIYFSFYFFNPLMMKIWNKLIN